MLAPAEAGAEVFARLKNAYRLRTGARERELVRHNVDLILACTAVVEGAVLLNCLVAERCWDQARWAVEAYAWRFEPCAGPCTTGRS